MNNRLVHWSCPGSLLMAGEYRVTEDSGIGLAVAAGPKGRAVIEPTAKEKQRVRGLWPGGGFEELINDCTNQKNDSLVAAALQEILNISTSRAPSSGSSEAFISTHSITVDTSSFFREDGGKLGYGSSAAACLLFCRSFSPQLDLHSLVQAAIRAHRTWQGGSGSGYDILASAFGGIGLFTGGTEPSWDSLFWPDDLRLWIIHAPKAVRTPKAVLRYKHWRKEYPAESETFLTIFDNSIDCLTRLFREASRFPAESAIEILRDLCVLGQTLGKKIGVPAEPILPDGLGGVLRDTERKSAAVKCLGAGNETTLLAALPDGLNAAEESALQAAIHTGTASVLTISKEGIKKDSGI